MSESAASGHRWRFFRTSGLDQVRVASGEDLANLKALDQKMWVALACPVKGLAMDDRTLAALDTDKDGRVRAREVLDAIAFCEARLKDLGALLRQEPDLPLSALDEGKPAGKAALAAARELLEGLGKPEAERIGLGDVADTAKAFAKTRFNGDGIVTPASSEDALLAGVITDIVATLGGEADRSGAQGVGQAKIDAFWKELEAVAAWADDGEARGDEVRPLGAKTEAAAAAVAAVKAKIDDYFARCRLVAFDARAQGALNYPDAAYDAVGAATLSASAKELAHFPLARVEPGRALPLAGVNPAWAAEVAALASDAVAPLLGERTELTEAEWGALQARLAAHLGWMGKRPDSPVQKLGLERVRAILATDAKAQLTELVARDAAMAEAFGAIEQLDKLIRLYRDLAELVGNFVSFERFYARQHKAIFQAGTLFLDGRSCDLCVRVDNPGKHAGLAALSKCFVAYCDLTRPGGEKMQIAAVFSDGDSDFLTVGRNGVFYDRQGKDWDATITSIVANPISIRQAFYAPYKRFVRLVEEQVAKRATEADTANAGKLTEAAQATAKVDQAKPPAKFDLSTIALIGVAVSGAAAVVGGLLEAFFGLGMWMPLGLLGLVLLISGPSMLIAALKLRQRSLGPILDATGWAINGRVALNIPFGGSLTQVATLPVGAERKLADPYQPRKSPWRVVAKAAVAAIVVGLVSLFGYHQNLLPNAMAKSMGFMGVPKHLRVAKEQAQTGVEEARAAVAAATEQSEAAKKTLLELVQAEAPMSAKVVRATSRAQRAEAKLARAQDRLDRLEARLEAANEALDWAIDADEQRAEEAEEADKASALVE